ncbi:MAG: peptidase domain-containing ABC transporter [Planctomycetota bacterium]|nr:peptidase domain-containing ABC transporter [Planctomycetota bacterium]
MSSKKQTSRFESEQPSPEDVVFGSDEMLGETRKPDETVGDPTPEPANSSGNPSQPSGPAGSLDSQEPKKNPHTSLVCLSLIARHHSVDISSERIIHEYSLEEKEPTLRRILRIAKDNKLKAKSTRIRWKDLLQMGEAFPVMAKLKNGNYVIFVGSREAEVNGKTETQIAIFDPLADRHDFIFVNKEELLKNWDGESILIKKHFGLLEQNQPFSLRWFIPEIFKQWTSFVDVAVAVIFIHMIALVTPLFFQIVIDKVLVNSAVQTLTVLTVGIVIALAFDGVLNFMRGYLLLNATSKIDVRVSTRTFQHLLRLPITFFDHITAGVLTKHMQQTSSIREFLTGSLFMTALDATALLVFVPVMYWYSPTLLMVVLIGSGLLGLVIGLLLGPYRRRLEALYQAEGDRQAMLVESIHGIQTVKALGMEPVQKKKWDDKTAQSVAMHYRVGKISTVATSISKFLEKLMTVMVICVGANLVFSGEISVGALVAFNMIAGRVTGPLVQLVSLVHSYQETALSVRMLGTVMNNPEEEGIDRGLRPTYEGSMEFENVTFHYSPTSPPALDDISIKIPAGKVVGVVGRSGSGKTTLTRLMQGLYKMQAGIMRVDGLDIRELDIAHLRRNIGVVLQENFLFRGTVRENIGRAKTNASFQEIVYAAKLAGADEFIERMPQSFDTMLEENGSNLSGGQKQRLAIARALLTDPRILIFDEATSALDPESEAIVQANLARIAKGRTVIIVSHRLSTLTGSDAIVVLERGKVADIGSHQTLLQSCQVYKELWYQQRGQA